MRSLILLLVIVGACSRSKTSEIAEPPAEELAESVTEAAPGPPPETPASAEGQQSKADKVDLDAPSTVELLDSGKPPRKALRMEVEPGTKESLRIESDWLVTAQYGPLISKTTPMPPLIYELELEAQGATGDSTRFEFQVIRVTAKSSEKVKPAEVESAKKVANSLKGVKGSFSISKRRVVENLEIDASSDASLLVSDMVDQIDRAVRLASLPLPEEPVGRGATWTVTQVIEQRTARFKQVSTVELLDLRRGRVRATSKYTAEAPKQDIKLPGSTKNARFLLDKLEFRGDSKGVWRLNRLGPSSATEHVFSGFIMTATTPKPEIVIMGVDTSLKVKPRP